MKFWSVLLAVFLTLAGINAEAAKRVLVVVNHWDSSPAT